MWLLVCILVVSVLLVVVARNHAVGMIRFKDKPAGYSNKVTLFKIIKTAFFGFNAYRSQIADTPLEYGYEYSVHKILPQNGVELIGWHISRDSSRGLVVLYNWFGGCKSDNLEAAEVFIELGYEVFLIDMRGHGDSSGNESYFGYHEYRDVLAGIEYVKYAFTPKTLIVYGVSLGAVATMRAFYAGEVDGVDALILEAPFDRLVNTIKHRVSSFKLPTFGFADLLIITGGVILKYNPYSFNPVSYAREVDLPVLLTLGNDDPYVMSTEVENIYNNLKNREKSECIFVSGHGHGSVVLFNKKLFKDRLKSFLEGI